MRYLGIVSEVRNGSDTRSITIKCKIREQYELISIYEHDLGTSMDNIRKGEYVTFNVERSDGFLRLRRVLAVIDEEDLETLYRLSSHKRDDVWKPAMFRLLRILDNVRAVAFLEDVLYNCSDSKIRSKVINITPMPLFMSSKILRSYMSIYSRFKVYVQIMRAEPDTDFQDMIEYELLPDLKKVSRQTQLHWLSTIPPDVIMRFPSLRKLMDPSEFLKHCSGVLRSSAGSEIDLADEIIDVTRQSKESAIIDFIKSLPRGFISLKKRLAVNIPDIARLLIYSELIAKENVRLIDLEKDIVRSLSTTPKNVASIREFISTIPLSEWKSSASVRSALPAKYRLEIYLELLNQGIVSGEDIRGEFIETSKLVSSRDLREFFDKLSLATLYLCHDLFTTVDAGFQLKLYLRLVNGGEYLAGDLIKKLIDILNESQSNASIHFVMESRISFVFTLIEHEESLKADTFLQIISRICAYYKEGGEDNLLGEFIGNRRVKIVDIARQSSPDTVLLFARSLPRKVIVQWRDIRDALAPEDHLRLCLAMWSKGLSIVSTDELFKEIIDVLHRLPASFSGWSDVPNAFLLGKRSLRNHLPNPAHVDYLLERINSDPAGLKRSHWIDELHDILKQTFDVVLWNKLTLPVLLYPQIREIAPKHILIQRLVEAFQSDPADDHVASIAIELGQTEGNERADLLKCVPLAVRRREPVLWMLADVQQAEAICSLLDTPDPTTWNTLWAKLSRETKLRSIYCAAQTQRFHDLCRVTDKDSDPVVHTALLVLRSKMATGFHKIQIFEQAHSALETFIVEQAWNTDAPLSVDHLLPTCYPKIVTYCEARPWPTEQEQLSGVTRTRRAFCPRGRCECTVVTADELLEAELRSGKLVRASSSFDEDYIVLQPPWMIGARLYADQTMPWMHWSLMELVDFAEIQPSLNGNPVSDYVSKLSGWVNRLNEIRQRLRCSVCGEPMIPNLKYAKFMARFRMTVASCRHGEGHDQNIYFNHCWACETIIDSRESRVLVEKRYLCRACGSGPEYSAVYAQGTRCPACNEGKMTAIADTSASHRCEMCNHRIKIPSQRKLTGPGSDRQHRPSTYEDL